MRYTNATAKVVFGINFDNEIMKFNRFKLEDDITKIHDTYANHSNFLNLEKGDDKKLEKILYDVITTDGYSFYLKDKICICTKDFDKEFTYHICAFEKTSFYKYFYNISLDLFKENKALFGLNGKIIDITDVNLLPLDTLIEKEMSIKEVNKLLNIFENIER